MQVHPVVARSAVKGLRRAAFLLALILSAACQDGQGVTSPAETGRATAPAGGPALNILTDPIATGTGVSMSFGLEDCSGTSCSETEALGNPLWGVSLNFKSGAVRQGSDGNLYRMVFEKWLGGRSSPAFSWASNNSSTTFSYCHFNGSGCTVYGPQWVKAEWSIVQVPALSGTIAGPASITLKGYYSWYTQVNNAEQDETFTYLWERSLDGSTWSTHSTASGFQQNFQTGDPSFYLRLTVTSNYGRTSTATTFVSVASNLEPAITAVISGPSSIRPNDECTWTGSATGGSGAYTYEWLGTQVDFDSYDGNVYTASATSPRTIRIRLDVSDGSANVGWVERDVTVSSSAPAC